MEQHSARAIMGRVVWHLERPEYDPLFDWDAWRCYFWCTINGHGKDTALIYSTFEECPRCINQLCNQQAEVSCPPFDPRSFQSHLECINKTAHHCDASSLADRLCNLVSNQFLIQGGFVDSGEEVFTVTPALRPTQPLRKMKPKTSDGNRHKNYSLQEPSNFTKND